MFAVDYQSPKRNVHTSSLLGDNVSSGLHALYSAHYSPERNPLNPNRQRRTSVKPRRSLILDYPKPHDELKVDAAPTNENVLVKVQQMPKDPAFEDEDTDDKNHSDGCQSTSLEENEQNPSLKWNPSLEWHMNTDL